MARQTRFQITEIFVEAFQQAFLENPHLDGPDLVKAVEEQLTILKKPAPQGNNGLSALAMFNERMFYKERVYPPKSEVPTPFDLWYQRPLFGKVDPDGDPIFAPQTYMKQLEGGSSNVWVLDFVADAFNDFKKEFLFLNKKAVEGTPFALLSPERGWNSVIVDYDNYMDLVYSLLTTYIADYFQDKEIISFDKFMNVFYRFVEIHSPNVPITLSQYIASPFCSPAASGLMLDISLDTHGNDTDKYNNFISNDNFICFTQTAERFGFKIDKNFPGRLIADIKSPVMTRQGDPNIPPSQGGQGYMRKYPKPPPFFTKRRPVAPQRISINPPTTVPLIPFEVGDPVEIMTSNETRAPNKHFTILRNFTQPENRARGAGANPRFIVDERIAGAPVRRNAYQFLKDNYPSAGAPAEATQILVGEIVEITPTQLSRETTWDTWLPTPTGTPPSSDPFAAPVFAGVFRPSGAMLAIVKFDRSQLMTENMPQRTERDSVSGATLEDFIDPNVLDWGNNPKKYPDNFEYGYQVVGGELFMEVPLDALHLSVGEEINPFIMDRFNERTSYQRRRQQWELQETNAARVHQSKLRDFQDRVEPAWLAAKDESDEKWLFYRTAERMASYNLFQRRYNKAYLFDMTSLKEICMQFYYSYTSANPVAVESRLVNCGGETRITKQKVFQREQISRTLMEQKYSTTYWLKQYLLIRNAESPDKKTFDTLRLIRRRVIEVYNKNGLNAALKYIKKSIPVLTYDTSPDNF